MTRTRDAGTTTTWTTGRRLAAVAAAVTAAAAAAAPGATAATSGATAAARTGGTAPGATTAAPTAAPRPAYRAAALGRSTLRRGSRGPAVRILQRWLAALGAPISADGVFGPATEAALRAFQRQRGRAATGRVDPATATALAAAMSKLGTGARPVVQPAAPGAAAGVRSAIVDVARSQLGVAERPLGSNCTPYGPCEAWCADFSTWVWRKAGVSGIGRIAYVPNLVLWAKQRGSWKPGARNNPQPGDMVIFSGLHVGLVERVSASGAITIIAGNTGTMNVARRGPASPLNGTAMGPAAISGYVSPAPVSGAARVAAAAALPVPTAAQMARQDPQDRDPTRDGGVRQR